MYSSAWLRAALIVSAASLVAGQQLSDVPNLATATNTPTTNAATTTTTAAATTSAGQQTTSNGGTTTGTTTSAAGITSFPSLVSSGPSTVAPTAVTSNGVIFSLSALPTIAGAGIPTLQIPNTAGAPFMQKSDLTEGTVFIAVGAVLAFLGLAVLLWRGLVAWSINRSVKNAALASIRGQEKPNKNWGAAGTGYNPAKGNLYKEAGGSVSLEALTPTGKPLKGHSFKDFEAGRNATPPPAGLFFSPTAQARNSTGPAAFGDVNANRNSSYLPAGYYAPPGSHVAGGARNTVVGAPMPPYARNSHYEQSPPGSPALRPHARPSHDNLRPPPSRDGMRNTIYSQPSNSSLTANIGAVGRPGSAGHHAASRQPSAYLDDLFENSTAMASRDRL